MPNPSFETVPLKKSLYKQIDIDKTSSFWIFKVALNCLSLQCIVAVFVRICVKASKILYLY
jgi:hypothetical protein